MTRILPIAAAAIAILAGGAWYLTQPGTGGTPATPPAFSASAQEAAEVDTSSVQEMVLGDEDAAVEVIEYASYTCPHCANFHETVFDDLKKDYIDTGKIKFTYREVYFDKYGLWASLIARCEPSKFFGITDLVYDGQQDWARAGSEVEIANALRKIGRLAGIDDDRLESCLGDGDKLRTLVAWYQQNAEEHGIRSTPSFVIDGETHKNMSYADFAEILDEKLGE